jgi:ABC-type nitrate/sulfonate/bicarbonate transport system permease component
MAETGRLSACAAASARVPSWVREHSVTALRIVIIVTMLVAWEALAQSGLLYRDVVPSLGKIGASLFTLLTVPDLPFRIDWPWLGIASDIKIPQVYWHLYATFYEIVLGMLIGALGGLAVGIAIGGSKLMQRAYEPFLYYLGPCPKIIFFPIMIMWFGVGPGSKVAMGAISCFFPVALNVAGGMREIDKVLIRVGRSFRANTWQMVTKIYMPAMRHPIINGMRLGLGVCLIGVLLAETKLSNRGVGHLVIDAYTRFDMPLMYALLIVLFVIAIGANALIGRLGGLDAIRPR